MKTESQAFLAPLASGLAGLALLLGHDSAAAWLVVVTALVFTGVNVLVVQRQRAVHTIVLLSALASLGRQCPFQTP
jgi:hypothetical protein